MGQALAGVSSRLLTAEGSTMLNKYQDLIGIGPSETVSELAIELADAVIKKLEAE